MMEQQLFILLFFTGVVSLVLSVPRKYYLIQQGKTWTNAQAYCRANHADLAIIQSNDNMVHIQNEAQRLHFSSSAWIGLYDDVNSWHWSMGNEPLGSFSSWVSQEPNNWHGIESCGLIDSYGWNDNSCNERFPFLCFDGTRTGNDSYIYKSNTLSWYNAQSYCRQYYTDLASNRDAIEHSVLHGLVSGKTWMGLIRNNWKWVDQTNFSTISWMLGKPDNALWNQNCGYLNNGQTVDAKCSNIMPFFCYSVITGRLQIMRVKVRTSQDANDPAVKAAILEKFKQKLKDPTMAQNITVKWKVQSDGKVFHKEN